MGARPLVSLWSLLGLSLGLSLVSLWSLFLGLSLVFPLWSLFGLSSLVSLLVSLWSLFGLSLEGRLSCMVDSLVW